MIMLQQLLKNRKTVSPYGIPSFCSANMYVLRALLAYAEQQVVPILIEATANQVNQYGGYTGMRPDDFVAFIETIAKSCGCSMNRVILGGDHLGPLTFQDEAEEPAMKQAEELIRCYVRSGFSKIHIDTSMKVADDPAGELDKQVCARRGAVLCKAAEDEFQKLLRENPDALPPVYVIGSEVPIPGGATQEETELSVTQAKDFLDTVNVYKNAFAIEGIQSVWNRVIAVVVQPGVEFGDNQVFYYDSSKAQDLIKALDNTDGLVFEGHSTDYQTEASLTDMAKDGISILKVGPELTFAFREALFLLTEIEKELVDEKDWACFPDILEERMMASPKDWIKHYHGTDKEQYLARKYSLSDRSRYYFADESVLRAQQKLFENLHGVEIPAGMVMQFFPDISESLLGESKDITPELLIEKKIQTVAKKYYRACGFSIC